MIKRSTFLQHTVTRFRKAGIPDPALDARLLFCHALACERADLLVQNEKSLTASELAAIEALIVRREKREPVARIIGQREFWGLPFALNEATLEPRPDSETLIEASLKHCKNPQRILDLGTGTGCLLLALLYEYPNATGLGIDCAPRAVEQAQNNAERLGLADRSTFRTGNWLDEIQERFDLIISNPPYIAAKTIPTLQPEVRTYDPLAALNGGEDGMDPYRLLMPQLHNFLKPNACATFELGAGQAKEISQIAQTAGFQKISLIQDYNNINRCLILHT